MNIVYAIIITIIFQTLWYNLFVIPEYYVSKNEIEKNYIKKDDVSKHYIKKVKNIDI